MGAKATGSLGLSRLARLLVLLLLPLPLSLPLFPFGEKGREEEEEAILAQSSDCSVQGIGEEKHRGALSPHFSLPDALRRAGTGRGIREQAQMGDRQRRGDKQQERIPFLLLVPLQPPASPEYKPRAAFSARKMG